MHLYHIHMIYPYRFLYVDCESHKDTWCSLRMPIIYFDLSEQPQEEESGPYVVDYAPLGH